MALKEFIKEWGRETPEDPERAYDAAAARRCLVELHQMGVYPSMQDLRNFRARNPFFFLANLLMEAKLDREKELRLAEGRARYLKLTTKQQEILDNHPDRGGWFRGTHRLPGVDF